MRARSVSNFADQECMSWEQGRMLRASSQSPMFLKIRRTPTGESHRTAPNELPPRAILMTAPFAFPLNATGVDKSNACARARKKSLFRPAAAMVCGRSRRFCRDWAEIAALGIFQTRARQAGIAAAEA